MLAPCHLTHLVPSNLQTYVLFRGLREHRVHSDLMAVHAVRLNRTSATVGGASATFHLPDSLVVPLLVRQGGGGRSGPGQPCVLAVLTELTCSPFTWARPRLRVRRAHQHCWKYQDASVWRLIRTLYSKSS